MNKYQAIEFYIHEQIFYSHINELIQSYFNQLLRNQYNIFIKQETSNLHKSTIKSIKKVKSQDIKIMNSETQEENITAKSWIIMERNTKKYCRGQDTMEKLQMASLTKMYTLFACLEINRLLNIQSSNTFVKITPSIEVGTLAKLKVNKYIKLSDLFYGLMLPSGNDAALVLAYYYGYWLGKNQKIPAFQSKKQKFVTINTKYAKIYLSKFMHFMNNNLVKQTLKHTDTHFENPHGLPDKLQKSTAWQIANAVLIFLSDAQFCKIVQTKSYQSSYLEKDDQTDSEQDMLIEWENTNILLQKQYGYIGIKTGHTVSAGNCLASRKIFQYAGKQYDLVIVVLGSTTLEERFTDTLAIVKSYKQYLKEMNI